ncbi:RNA polymerase sigma factor region1.1 domain-containing protein, partial [Acetobacter orientalis]
MATKTASGSGAQVEQDGDTTRLDTQSSAVKKLIAKGRERGCITFDELNAVLPQDKM